MAKHESTIGKRSTAPAKTPHSKPRANGAGAERKCVSHDQMFAAMTVIEDAMIDMGETVFLLDQIQAHGEAFDDRGRAYSRVARLLIAEMASLSAEYTRAHDALRAGTPIERKAVEGAQ